MGSGITADIPKTETAEFLRTCIEHLVCCFGSDRLVWGSDWPVCETGAGLAGWCELTRQLLAALPLDSRNAILRDNAIRVYGIEQPAREHSRSQAHTES